MVGTTSGLIEAQQPPGRSEKKAKETAETREAETRAVLDFVETRIFGAARPQGQLGGLGGDVSMRRAIESALPFMERSFTYQPLIEAAPPPDGWNVVLVPG